MQPQTQTTPSLAYQFGAQDARNNQLCVPEMLFTHKADKRDYCRGFASVKGHNMTTRQILGKAA